MRTVTVTAHPNIALVKYWGKRDLALNLPAVSSLSLTVAPFASRTRLSWGTPADVVQWDGGPARPDVERKILAFLDRFDPDRPPCRVETANNFPSAAGLASSSSGFAALAVAAARASGSDLSDPALSALARQGSGSACRSLWGGFVVWDRGSRDDGADSVGRPLFGPDHWDLRLVVAIVSGARKKVGSTQGMLRTAATSPYYDRWVDTAEADVAEAVSAVAARDLEALGRVMERSTFKMHATMHTSEPPLLYWQPATVACLHAVAELREAGVDAWSTMDAGPNVKVLCAAADAQAVHEALTAQVDEVVVLHPGGAPTVEVA